MTSKQEKRTKKVKTIIYFPARKIYHFMPDQVTFWMREKFSRVFRYQSSKSEEILNQSEEFIIKQISVVFWGTISIIILGGVLWLTTIKIESSLYLTRNVFGQGKKQVALKLENERESTEVYLDVEEQQADQKEINLLYTNFFRELEGVMCGKNQSLNKVCNPLYFAGELKGYPFYIQYEVEDMNCIKLDGSLGESAKNLEEGTLETEITVVATYLNYEREKIFHIVVVPKENEVSPFTEVKEKLMTIEKDTRSQSDFSLPSHVNGINIAISNSEQNGKLLIFLMIFILVGTVVGRYETLKNKEKLERETVINDFPVIVHLLTLYTGAGLSFARAIHRIAQDYKMGFLVGNEKTHYAFDEIVSMDIKMQTGLSQKEVCEQWAKDMDAPAYRKLSLLLIQSLSKGTGDIGFFMKRMEKEVFSEHIDRVKKRGEEASSKLLFPMIVLMGLVMIIIMVPALMQFGGF